MPSADRAIILGIAAATAIRVALGLVALKLLAVETVTRAMELSELARISFWDALIVASAEEVMMASRSPASRS